MPAAATAFRGEPEPTGAPEPALVDGAARAEVGGWPASLRLRLGPRAGRTRLLDAEHFGPLRVQRAFHPEPDGTAHLVVLHPPAGMVGGDTLSVHARVEAAGRALLTTTGAAKAYRSGGRRAAMVTTLDVGAGAYLEHVPQESVVFDGADAALVTRVELAEGARFLGWEVVCLGRPACDERFQRGALRLELAVSREGRPCFLERGHIEGGSNWLTALHGAQGHAAFGTLLATDGDPAIIREVFDEAALVGVTRVHDLTVVRAFGRDGAAVRALLERARHVVRDAWGRPRVDPAIWRS